MMNDWWGSAGWGVWMMIVLAMVSLAAVIIGVVFLVLGLLGDRAGGTERSVPLATRPDGDARDIVRRRYAAGEIDSEEYEQKMRDLDG